MRPESQSLPEEMGADSSFFPPSSEVPFPRHNIFTLFLLLLFFLQDGWKGCDIFQLVYKFGNFSRDPQQFLFIGTEREGRAIGMRPTLFSSFLKAEVMNTLSAELLTLFFCFHIFHYWHRQPRFSLLKLGMEKMEPKYPFLSFSPSLFLSLLPSSATQSSLNTVCYPPTPEPPSVSLSVSPSCVDRREREEGASTERKEEEEEGESAVGRTRVRALLHTTLHGGTATLTRERRRRRGRGGGFCSEPASNSPAAAAAVDLTMLC